MIGMARKEPEVDTAEVERTTDRLCRDPAARSLLDGPEAKRLLLDTGGRLFVRGDLREVRISAVGAGIYRVWTEAVKDGDL